MDWGKREGDTGTDRQTRGGGGDTIWVFWGPRSRGTRGDCPCGSTRARPSAQLWGQFARNGVFSAQPEGCCPHLPGAVVGGWIWGAESSKAGEGLQSWGWGGLPSKPKPAAGPPLQPPQPCRALGGEKNG